MRAMLAHALAAILGFSAAPALAQTATTTVLELHTLSTRPETVSGGEVLVQIAAPRAVALDRVTASLNGRDVRRAFKPGPRPQTLVGLVTGLNVGSNRLEAAAPGQKTAQLTLVNHPSTGPVIAGPHQTPFVCETESFGLGPALDANCSVKTRVEYFYRIRTPATAMLERPARSQQSGPAPVAPGANSAAALAAVDQAALAGGRGGGGNAQQNNPFRPLDPSAPHPADLATTTTTDGRTVPYIVRREMGTINRAVYVIAFLHEPGTPLPDPWTSGAWNGRLVYSFGGGCRAGYHQGRSVGGLTAGRSYLEESQLGDYAIARGYALAGGSLNVFGTTCADLISAETTMMVKEHFIERFGVPRYTIGSGRSGGSMQQHLIANNYPGLLDGIIPTASFADTVTFLASLSDCEVLHQAFNDSSLPWTPEQKAAVAGHATWAYCDRNAAAYPNLRPTNCDPDALPKPMIHDAEHNRAGARCTYQDNMVNVYGRDPRTGFARRPFDNEGIQYGLGALNDGAITLDQFIEVNRRAGGHDIDGHLVARRTAGDPEAIRVAYETGRVNDTSRGLSTIPIVDVRLYTDGDDDVHDIVANHITRARLIAANGHANNQVFRTYAPGTPIQAAQRYVLDAMDEWLNNISRDTAPARSPLDKVVRNKPSNLVDTCYLASLEPVTDPTRCRALFPVHANPRLAAGEPMTQDRVKCELKPVERTDYKVAVTEAQLAQLRDIFPGGVCDYSRPGVGKRPPHTWLSYPRPGSAEQLARTDR